MERRLISSGSTFEQQMGYSRAVVAGDWVFVSGTTGFDYVTMTIADGGAYSSRAHDGVIAVFRVNDDSHFRPP